MNKLFLDDLTERLEEEFSNVNVCDQKGIKCALNDSEFINFPMICFERTNDSAFEVDVDESKFLNDNTHNGSWFVCGDEFQICAIFNLKDYGSKLEIDALEVNSLMRYGGKGGNIVSIIESVAEDYYKEIIISPFDTDAINFWEHMEYNEEKNGYWIKEL